MRRRQERVVFFWSIVKIFLLLAVATAIGQAFVLVQLSVSNIIVIYILGVIAAALWTEGRTYSLGYSVMAVVAFNFFFAEPRYSFVFEAQYLTTFVVMFLVALLVSTITTRLKEETTIRREIEEKARHEALRSNLLRSISHDLRTPLTGISGNASLLLERGNELSEDKKVELYTSISEDAHWLTDLVENLLAITRVKDVEGGEIDLNLQIELVEDVIEEALKHCDRRISRHNIVREAEDDLLLAKMDARLMLQVFINLVNNAIKYTQDGSTITIATRREGDEAVISVADDGPGIKDEDKTKIFERFYTARHTNPDSRRGLGLGLALCCSVVDAHGGHISVRDNVPHGTVFEFTLPVVEVNYE